ncbi:hypothetical protein LEP1GSC043_2554 [Leptospira weilii str. Ecochallenge]|uniref:Uncharacterized protein n=1 Tax=Leptospira weilii str. Ecochallenge TaxID=1049986 RepID=N1U2X4_9LEPT|nr:hypothetical protein LEP1GSC043_2554 [Leptospira weilii str. Ecochallenge]
MEKFRQLITRRSHPIDAVRCFFPLSLTTRTYANGTRK